MSARARAPMGAQRERERGRRRERKETVKEGREGERIGIDSR